MVLRRPQQQEKKKFKIKSLIKNLDDLLLKSLADRIEYSPSQYHCPVEGKGRSLRSKPATPCPKRWKKPDAEQAIRRSIVAGRISEAANGEFPRHVWYRDGDGTIYEAASEVGTPSRYHAYPIPDYQVPKGLTW